MAFDWIKMRTDLYRHPKVCLIADRLLADGGKLSRYVSQNCQRDMTVTRNVMRNVTVGALVTVWGVTRHRGERKNDDLILKDMSLAVIDDVADLPGIGDALASVGWIEQAGDDLIFPRFFEELNVEPGTDYKKSNAERQRRYREKRNGNSNVTDNVTVTSQSNAREEKRREEKSNTPKAPKGAVVSLPELPLILNTPQVRSSLEQWLKYKGKAYKPQGMTAMVNRAEAIAKEQGTQAIVDAIDRAMANGWKGWDFPDRQPPKQTAQAAEPIGPAPPIVHKFKPHIIGRD